MQLHCPYTGAILAGGKSRRIGFPKEGIKLWDGRQMIEHVIDAFSGVCPKVAIIGESRGFDVGQREGLIHVPDNRTGCGPLAGIEALLASGLASGYIIAACDQPLLTPEIVRSLVMGDPGKVHLFSTDDPAQFEPFPGYYPAALLTDVRSALENGERSIRSVVERDDVVWAGITRADRLRLKSANTVGDLEELRTLAFGAIYGTARR